MNELGGYLLSKQKNGIPPVFSPDKERKYTASPQRRNNIGDGPKSPFWSDAIDDKQHETRPNTLKWSPTNALTSSTQKLRVSKDNVIDEDSVASLLLRFKGSSTTSSLHLPLQYKANLSEDLETSIEDQDKKLVDNVSLMSIVSGIAQINFGLQKNREANLASFNGLQKQNDEFSILTSKILQELKSEPANIIGNHEPMAKYEATVDKPTKMLIMTMNDKLNQLNRMHEHELSSLGKKITRLTESLTNTHPSVDQAKNKIYDRDMGRIYDELHLISSSLSKDRRGNQSYSSLQSVITDSTSGNQYAPIILEKLDDLKLLINSQSDSVRLNEERMNEFLTMLGLLQDAHTRLVIHIEPKDVDTSEIKSLLRSILAKLDTTVRPRSISSIPTNTPLIESIHQTLVSYLPLNLESKLNEIHSALHLQPVHSRFSSRGSNPRLDTSSVGGDTDVINRGTAIMQSLDSIQHTLSRVLEAVGKKSLLS